MKIDIRNFNKNNSKEFNEIKREIILNEPTMLPNINLINFVLLFRV